jgi:hypothetical protein
MNNLVKIKSLKEQIDSQREEGNTNAADLLADELSEVLTELVNA